MINIVARYTYPIMFNTSVSDSLNIKMQGVNIIINTMLIKIRFILLILINFLVK